MKMNTEVKINRFKKKAITFKSSMNKKVQSVDIKKIKQDVLPSIVVITSYPPRECGIATYSKDLIDQLNTLFSGSFAIKVCHVLENADSLVDIDDFIALNPDSEQSYDEVSEKINKDPSVNLILIQHEFGLFSQNPKKFLSFLNTLEKPVIMGFHTVLPNPDSVFRTYVIEMIKKVEHIIVMTKSSKEILERDYECDPKLISIISHGTHLIAHRDKDELKEKYGYSNKTILSNFGLLGPGKSIETTLDALPQLIKEYQDLLFLIIGKSHPGFVKNNGESYRESLLDKVNKLNLNDHVAFVNKFVPLESLLEYLQLTDIYLFTSKDPNQAVSGTFSYAMSCGCPIVSTPIPHAKEVLKQDNGLLFDFGNSDMLAQQIKILLKDKQHRENLGMNSLHASASNAWENSGIAHAELFNKLDSNIKLKFNLPEFKLDHLKNMTTSIGLIQFCVLNQPDIKSGYTLDDNARALILVCKSIDILPEESFNKLFYTYVGFLLNCQRFDGSFLNYVDEKREFTDQNNEVNLEDSNGRAIWALGELISISSKLDPQYGYLLTKVEEAINEFLPNLESIKSPRAIAFTIKGLYYANTILKRDDLKIVIEKLGADLFESYSKESDDQWHWFESYLTYGNAVLPEAMLLAYKVAQDERYEEVAKNSFRFLLKHICSGSKFQVISNQNWFKKGDNFNDQPVGGQQPIDVAYTILALGEFYKYYEEEKYLKYMTTAFSWFLGNNHLSQTVYNPCTKGCYDGIEATNVNLNQGAESILSYLLSRITMEEIASK